MIPWEPVAGWMRFPYLSVSAGLTSSYTLTYKLTDDTAEHWTARLVRFKNGDRAASFGGARLFYAALPRLIETAKLNVKEVVFIPALSSGETAADQKRTIPFIASECAGLVGARYEGSALSKTAHRKIHDFYKAEARDAELEKAEYRAKKVNAKHIFIFDDFITRGATLSKIATALLANNENSQVYGIALAKAERVAWCPNPTNDHVPKKWDQVWLAGEQEVTNRSKE